MNAEPDGYCYACEGYGYWDRRDFDMVPYGSMNVHLDTVERDACPECAEHGTCPQCGGELSDNYDDDTSACVACGHVVDWEHGPNHYRDEHEDDRY